MHAMHKLLTPRLRRAARLLPACILTMATSITLPLQAYPGVVVKELEDVRVLDAVVNQGEVWFATDDGVYVGRPDGLSQILSFEQEAISALGVVNDEVWFGARDRLFRVGPARVENVDLGSRLYATRLLGAEGDAVWVGTESGLFLRSSDGHMQRRLDGFVQLLERTDHGVIVGTRSDTFILDPDLGEFVPLMQGYPLPGVITVVSHERALFLLSFPTDHVSPALYRYSEGRIDLVSRRAVTLASLSGRLWYSTLGGEVFIYEGEPRRHAFWSSPKAWEEPMGSDLVRMIKEARGEIWFMAESGVYRQNTSRASHPVQVLSTPAGHGFEGMIGDSRVIWFWGDGGIYRLNEELEIEAYLNTVRAGSLDILFDNALRVNSLSYTNTDGVIAREIAQGENFAVVVGDNLGALASQISRGNWRKSNEAPHRIGRIFSKVFFAVRDDVGNVRLFGPRQVLVISNSFLMPLALLTLGLALFVFALRFSPFSIQKLLFKFASLTLLRLFDRDGRFVFSLPWVRAIVRRIFIHEHVACGRHDLGALQKSCESLVQRLSSRQVVLLRDGEGSPSLSRLQCALALSTSPGLREAIPLAIKLGNWGPSELRTEVPARIREELLFRFSFIPERTVESLIRHTKFIFLFAVDPPANLELYSPGIEHILYSLPGDSKAVLAHSTESAAIAGRLGLEDG